MIGTWIPFIGFRTRYRRTPISEPVMTTKYPQEYIAYDRVSDTFEIEWLGHILLIHVSKKAMCVSDNPKDAILNAIDIIDKWER